MTDTTTTPEAIQQSPNAQGHAPTELEQQLQAQVQALTNQRDEFSQYLDNIAAIPEVDKAEGGCDVAVRNAILTLKMGVESQAAALEEAGRQLQAAVAERDAAIAEVRELEAKLADALSLKDSLSKPSCEEPTHYDPADEIKACAEAVLEACAQAAGATGHWVRRDVNVSAIIASQKK